MGSSITLISDVRITGSKFHIILSALFWIVMPHKESRKIDILYRSRSQQVNPSIICHHLTWSWQIIQMQYIVLISPPLKSFGHRRLWTKWRERNESRTVSTGPLGPVRLDTCIILHFYDRFTSVQMFSQHLPPGSTLKQSALSVLVHSLGSWSLVCPASSSVKFKTLTK